MPLPHYPNRPRFIGQCKYCGEDIYAFDQWRIEQIDNMKNHIEKNKCKSIHREERLKKILDGNN